jgi:hypothetical protein
MAMHKAFQSQNSLGNLLGPGNLDSVAIFTNLHGVPMPTFVTVNTKRNQVFGCIMTELTSRIHMMDFQHHCRTAILTSPSISVQHLNSKCFVAHRI